ncbi:MAG: hypothetical protein NVS4B1_33430 [Ktedonobacteraceae bacterium]
MIILANIYFDVLRSLFTAATGTDVAKPYLSHIEGRIGRIKESDLLLLGASAIYADYDLYAESSVDIRKGDVITNIFRKDTGLKWFNQTDMETWRVLQSTVSSPGFLEYRDITLGRFIGGGPSQAL